MKKFHYKDADKETCHERGYLLGFISENTYELREFEKSFTGQSSLIKAEMLKINDIEKYIEENGFEACYWSPDIQIK